MTFYMFSVWLHILAAAIWIGGMVFLVVVLVPVSRREEFRVSASSLIHFTGIRFRWVGWICLVTLLLTGTVNLTYRGIGWEELRSGRLWEESFGQVLGIKLLLLGVIFFLSALHDFAIGPRATALGQVSPRSPDAMRLRRQASWIGRLNLLLALVSVALGVVMVRGWPW